MRVEPTDETWADDPSASERHGPASDATPGPMLGDPALEPGTEIGRYVVLERIGSGGMGVVYAAYDGELDRKVALKLVHAYRSSETARARLVREAQAMARLSHPNVVTVHDVGTHDDRVFVAMEYVQGRTLRQFLADEPDPDEVMHVFVQAGLGLVAAHAAGLIHRDFKPDNVLIDRGGRARVLDFGLARAAGLDADEDSDPDHSASSSMLSVELTRAGRVIGTPAYMSPEQVNGLPVDARADQFSFCVALYEGLHGVRPFAGQTLDAVVTAVLDRAFETGPRSRSVPARVQRALERGLSAVPDDRFPSMQALLDELRPPETAGRRNLSIGATVAVLGTAAWIGWARTPDAGSICERARDPVVETWNETSRAAIDEAFAGTKLPYASATATATLDSLDAYVREWSAAHRDVCEATHVRGEQSARLLDLRMACLDRERQELQALTTVLAEADVGVVEHAVAAAAGLPDPARCQTLLPGDERPMDPATQALREELAPVLAEAAALERTGRYEQGLTRIEPAIARAREADDLPTLATALLWQGRLASGAGDHEKAREVLLEATWAAEAGRADEVAAQAWIRLVYDVGDRLQRPKDARAHARRASAAVRRLDDPPRLQASLLAKLGDLDMVEAEFDDADEHLSRALELTRADRGEDSLEVAGILNAQGIADLRRGRFDEATAHLEAALAIREPALGGEHPLVADVINNLGNVRGTAGDYERALDYHRRALDLRERLLGPDHVDVADALDNVGNDLHALGRPSEARAAYVRSLGLRRRGLGDDHPATAASLVNVARIDAAEGHLDQAIDNSKRALAVFENTLGPEHPHVAYALSELGDVLLRRGDADEAAQTYARALAIDEKVSGPESPELCYALDGLGRSELERGDEATAVEVLDRALGLCGDAEFDPLVVASIRLALARGLNASGGDRERARELATAAKNAWAQAGATEQAAEADAVLEKMGAGARLAAR